MKAIKKLAFAVFTVLMITSPVFAAEQSSWWSNAWSQIKSFFSFEKYGKPSFESARQYVNQNPEKSALIIGGTVCVIGGAYALKKGYDRFCQNRIITAIQNGDKKAKDAALENLFLKVWMPPANWRASQQTLTPQQQRFVQLLKEMNTSTKSSKDRKEVIERIITEAKRDYLQGKLDLVDEYILQQPYIKEELINHIYKQAIAESGKSPDEIEESNTQIVFSEVLSMVKRYPHKFNNDLIAINNETDVEKRKKMAIDFIQSAKNQYLSDSTGHGYLTFDAVLNNHKLRMTLVDRIIEESKKYTQERK